MSRIADAIHTVAEQAGDITRSLMPWSWVGLSGIRGNWNGERMGLRFWPTPRTGEEGSEVNYSITRSLYRNEGDTNLGGMFAKPIVDLQAAFMGIPRATVENESLTQFLNECLTNYWVDEIQQMFRDTIRDSKCIVRLQKPDILDPLMTMEESRHCRIEIISPELVDIERNVRNRNIIERAVVHHTMLMVIDDGDPANGRDPITEEHDVIEIIDREQYRFFDQTTHQWIADMQARNAWGFVPLLEVYNEWDASLQGGMSDLETVIPFIRAFHDVLTQGIQAHGYHSTPKVVMNLNEIEAFLKNNFPELVDSETGQLKASGEITWRGREILFLSGEEEVSFLEAKSILSDTKTLLEFLIDCICIAAQTPEWAFMRVDSGSANSDRNAQTVPFIKKIDRKRRNFTKPVQDIMKMMMVALDMIPERAAISWDMIRSDDQMIYYQAFQQLVMGLEVARERGEISDETYQNAIRPFLPMMRSNSVEFTKPIPQPVIPAAVPIVAGPQGKNE